MKSKFKLYVFVFMMPFSSELCASEQPCKDTNSAQVKKNYHENVKFEWTNSDYRPEFIFEKDSMGHQFGLLQHVIVPHMKLQQAQLQGKKMSQSEKIELQILTDILVKDTQKHCNEFEVTKTK